MSACHARGVVLVQQGPFIGRTWRCADPRRRPARHTRDVWLISSLERAFEVGTDAVGNSTANRVEIVDRDRVYGAGSRADTSWSSASAVSI